MKDQNLPPLKRLDIFFLSMGGLGFAKRAPGTMGSLGAVPILFFMGLIPLPGFIYLPILTLATVGSCFVADSIQREFNVEDPQWIVIDEGLGMWTAWIFHPSSHPLDLLIVFALFRLFDITKIWPVSYVQNNIKSGTGTIVDDTVAGIIAGIIYYFFNTATFT